MLNRTRIMASSAALSAPLLLITGLTAAADDTSHVDTIAAVIEDAAPDGAVVAHPDTVDSDALTFITTGPVDDVAATGSVAVPVDSDQAVVIDASNGSVLEVLLPNEVTVNDAGLAEDGTVVYTDSGSDAHVAVQALDDGAVRLQTVLENENAPSTYTYDLGDVTPVLLEDGSIELQREVAEGLVSVVGTVAEPWAVDALGNAVDTWYTVQGTSLVQHVNHDQGTAYPVTADPTLSFGWAVYWKWSKSEVRSMASKTSYAQVLSAFCAAIKNSLPTTIGCTVVLSGMATYIDNAFQAAKEQGKCVQSSQPYAPTPITLAAQLRMKVVSC